MSNGNFEEIISSYHCDIIFQVWDRFLLLVSRTNTKKQLNVQQNVQHRRYLTCNMVRYLTHHNILAQMIVACHICCFDKFSKFQSNLEARLLEMICRGKL
jgi:hypothetical protein